MGRSFDWRVRGSGDPAPISPSPLARARWLGPGSRTGICDGASVAVLLVLDVAVPDYDISPGILLPLLGGICALLGLEVSAVWRSVK